jgi:hypothetical protein
MLVGGMPQEGEYDPLIGWFAREGIPRERLELHARCSTAAYLALHHRVDICLDTFPYTGGTTTSHALWMGVPTLTIAGHTPPGRQGAALLGHVGLEAFVAEDAADFARKGSSWAGDVTALAAVRAGLRERCEQSPIRKSDVIAAGLECAFRRCGNVGARPASGDHRRVKCLRLIDPFAQMTLAQPDVSRKEASGGKGAKAAIMQPYFPYVGYFQLIDAVDLFIVCDNIKYTKKGWINRATDCCRTAGTSCSHFR